MILGMPILFLWDFHDTLETGTLEIVCEIANSLLKQYGSTTRFTPQQIATRSKFSWKVFFAQELPHLSSQIIDRMVEEAYDEGRFGYLRAQYSRPQTGAIDILRTIREHGDWSIILSNCRPDILKSYLDQFRMRYLVQRYFGIDDGMIHSEFQATKKKIVIARQFLAHSSISFDEINVIGDSIADHALARAIKAKNFFLLKHSQSNSSSTFRHLVPPVIVLRKLMDLKLR